MTPAQDLLQASADDLATTASSLTKIATELQAASKGLPDDPSKLRDVAAGVQAEAMRCAMTALSVRAVSERLAVVATLADTRGKP